jgi:hypothetical protein
MRETMKRQERKKTRKRMKKMNGKISGMFDESVNHSEDYLLSKQYPADKFKISNHYVGQDDRRFKKMGYMFMVVMLIKGFINKDNIDYFKKDIGYW